MRKKNYKGRCEKQSLDKFTTVCKTYEPLQTAYANILANSKDIVEARYDNDPVRQSCFGLQAG